MRLAASLHGNHRRAARRLSVTKDCLVVERMSNPVGQSFFENSCRPGGRGGLSIDSRHYVAYPGCLRESTAISIRSQHRGRSSVVSQFIECPRSIFIPRNSHSPVAVQSRYRLLTESENCRHHRLRCRHTKDRRTCHGSGSHYRISLRKFQKT